MSVRLVWTALLPLLYLPWSYEVREAPRAAALALLALGAFGTALAAATAPRWPRALWAAAFTFAAWLLATTGMAADSWRSFFGPFPHGPAALSWLCYLVLLLRPPPQSQIGRWLGAVVVLGLGQVGLAFVQLAVFDGPPVGTFGHVSFFAAFVGMAALVAGAAALASSEPRRRRALAAAATALLVALGASGRRAPVVALALVGAAALLWLRPRRGLGWLAGGAAVVLLGAAAVQLLDPGALDPAGRYLGGGDAQATLAARGTLYRVGLAHLAERPFRGWGFGDFRDFLSDVELPGALYEGRAHNLLLELGLGAGIPAVLIFVVLAGLWLQRAGQQLGPTAGADDPQLWQRRTCLGVLAYYLLWTLANVDQAGLGVWAVSLGSLAVTPDPAPGTTDGTTDGRVGAAPRRAWRLAVGLAALAASALLLRPLLAQLTLAAAERSVRAGDIPAAEGALQRAAALAPSDGYAETRLASLWQERDGASSAQRRLTLLDGLHGAARDSPYVLMAQCAAHAERGGPQDARAALRACSLAQRRSPGDPAIARTLARLLAGAGRYPQAKAVLQQAAARAPGDAAVLNDLGVVLHRGGDPAAARPYFERALALEPANLAYRRNLDRAAEATP